MAMHSMLWKVFYYRFYVYLPMISWFLDFLYGSRYAQFESQYSLHEAAFRLAGEVKPSRSSRVSEPCAVGTVTEKEVLIYRETPYFRNSWKPIFVGSFECNGNKTILKGKFRFSTWKVLSTLFVFLFIAVWTLRATDAVISNSSKDLSFPLAGVAMFGFNTAMILYGKWSARKDVDCLSKVISAALHAKRDNN